MIMIFERGCRKSFKFTNLCPENALYDFLISLLKNIIENICQVNPIQN